MPIRQDTLRERWLAQQRYAPTTKQTYRETLTAFERRFPVYAEHVRPEHLIDFLTTDGTRTAMLSTIRDITDCHWRRPRTAPEA